MQSPPYRMCHDRSPDEPWTDTPGGKGWVLYCLQERMQTGTDGCFQRGRHIYAVGTSKRERSCTTSVRPPVGQTALDETAAAESICMRTDRIRPKISTALTATSLTRSFKTSNMSISDLRSVDMSTGRSRVWALGVLKFWYFLEFEAFGVK